MNEKFCISIRISLKFVPKGLINNKSALAQAVAWRRTGDKPLPEPMLTQFTNAYMRYNGEMSQLSRVYAMKCTHRFVVFVLLWLY